MRRLAVVVLAGLLAVEARPALAEKPADLEKAIFAAVNAHRAREKRDSLTLNATLAKIAQGHARAMARADRFGDSGTNGHIVAGKGPLDRVKAGGYAFAALAENVGWNAVEAPAERMMKDWSNSPPHRKNMLDRNVTQAGVGAARGASGRWYFVLLLARPQSQEVKFLFALENRTSHTIRFRLGTSNDELKAGQKATYRLGQPQGKVRIVITWPEGEGTSADLADGTRYAFIEKKKGVFAFARVGAL